MITVDDKVTCYGNPQFEIHNGTLRNCFVDHTLKIIARSASIGSNAVGYKDVNGVRTAMIQGVILNIENYRYPGQYDKQDYMTNGTRNVQCLGQLQHMGANNILVKDKKYHSVMRTNLIGGYKYLCGLRQGLNNV